jgi:hypothetical protein
MKRKGGFYNYILVLPCVLLSCLTTVLFWLPPESPAKMVLGMNIFTSFFVLLLLLSKNVPSATDKIPLIGAYYCLNMVMIATSTCSCTAVVHIYFRGQGQVPFLIRKIFLEFLARVLCMTRPPVLPPPPPSKRRPMANAVKRMKNIAAAAAAAAMGQDLPTQQQQQATNIQTELQPAPIVTSINGQSQTGGGGGGGVVHHLNRSPNFATNRLSQQMHLTASCQALNCAGEEGIHLMPPSSPAANVGLGGHPLAPPYLNHHHPDHVYLTVNGNQPSHFSFHVPSPPIQPRQSHQQQQQPTTSTSSSHAGPAPPPTQTLFYNELSLSFNLIENDIKEIRDYLRHTRKKLETTDAKAKQTNEWKQVALVLDRTLFFLYIIAIVVSVNLMFPK